MTEDMLKCIVQTLDMLLTQAMRKGGHTKMFIDQQDKLHEIFKKELKDAPRT